VAEFQEMVREFHRLCETQRRLHKNTCDKCPIKIATMGTMFQCYRYVLEKPEDAENIIMSWAAENPEPVYPTWGEWFAEQGELSANWKDLRVVSCSGKSSAGIIGLFYNEIPSDIAQKLGIEPKEG